MQSNQELSRPDDQLDIERGTLGGGIQRTHHWFIRALSLFIVDLGPDGTLSVEAATDRMAIYRCIAKNDAGSDNIEYTVHTISAPSVTKDGDVNLNATQGDPAELICNIDGDDSKIVWQKVPVVI